MKHQVIVYSTYRDTLFRWKPLSDIPNEQGFQFIGKRKDGLSIVCEVGKEAGENGCHYIVQGKVSDFQSWRDITEEDMEALKN